MHGVQLSTCWQSCKQEICYSESQLPNCCGYTVMTAWTNKTYKIHTHSGTSGEQICTWLSESEMPFAWESGVACVPSAAAYPTASKLTILALCHVKPHQTLLTDTTARVLIRAKSLGLTFFTCSSLALLHALLSKQGALYCASEPVMVCNHVF